MAFLKSAWVEGQGGKGTSASSYSVQLALTDPHMWSWYPHSQASLPPPLRLPCQPIPLQPREKQWVWQWVQAREPQRLNSCKKPSAG